MSAKKCGLREKTKMERIKFKYCNKLKNKRVRVKLGWETAGKEGIVVGSSVFLHQWWTPVLWVNEEDPDFFKQSGLELC